MRRNDFFKSLLFSGGSAASRVELETETLPYTFTSNSHKLRNYRIYGNTVNGESVGDLVTEGEYAGEYRVPVKVEGKNMLQSSDFEAGAIFTGQRYIDRSYQNSKTGAGQLNYDSTRKRSTNLITISGTYTISIADGWGFGIVMFPNGLNSGESFTYSTEPVTISNCTFAIQIRKPDASDISSADISDYQIMLAKGSTATPYEPYHAPDTTNLYLPEQIKMVGDEAEYVDYKEQKQYFADGTSTDVTLPALPTLSGTNTLSVGTTVQPSKIYLQGKISEIETVSAQSLQASPRTLDLQPLSLDVMPIDRDEFQINDISEMSVEEIPETENLETTGDEENAE